MTNYYSISSDQFEKLLTTACHRTEGYLISGNHFVQGNVFRIFFNNNCPSSFHTHSGFCSADRSQRPETQASSRSNCWKASKGYHNSGGGEKRVPCEVFPPQDIRAALLLRRKFK
ncbi:hypothetical protein CDAR_573251 [Caerostris darwini]|uniref:Uncharacterized protein n=1 Tax=Caerostris darwini TaxID=1538125 RepID=A0AAV4M5A5_9ARAC|nr:hypothetical protein CDAR_573251 [Caerostris darwini]